MKSSRRVFDLAWTHSQVVLRQLNSSEADAQLYGRLAASIIYNHSALRADPAVIIRNRRGQSGLWGYSISGDVPIVLLQIEDTANINLVRQMVQAHNYWRLKGLTVDLVIWNEDHAEYRQLLHDQIMAFLASGADSTIIDRPGGIFLRSTEQISAEDRVLFETVARVIINDRRGTLAEQVNRVLVKKEIPQFLAGRNYQYEAATTIATPRPDLVFFNGFGGFTPDGREYIITTAQDQITPAPWVNVLANPNFGTVISEGGQSYTWADNAHEFRLTPWQNDPVSDTGGEAFYIRDEEQGCFWSPLPLPSRGLTPYTSRHGFGYSIFEHTEREISSETTVYVAIDASVKFTVIKITNNSHHQRKLSVTGYAEWVLGDLRSKSAMHIVTETDPSCNAIFARNGYSMDFAGKVAFFDTDDSGRTFTGDRGEFVGRNRNLANPLAMSKTRLSGKVGAALDPCAAIQICFSLEAGEEREVIFKLGVGKDKREATAQINRFRGSSAARGALEQVWGYWNNTLDTIKIETPDPALNMLTNGWLIYQTIACRLWARSGFYQSGGAFGFRDQLQDIMAIAHIKPELAREQIILCASRQFSEGDVQHWWHPPVGRGVRTQCSDDFLWLPLAVSLYITQTGDSAVLEQNISFLKGRIINIGEESYYDLATKSEESATLYDHCVRAILKGKNYGEHGLPKIGSGDWNDGMNEVGKEGLGESVWLGFFYYEVLSKFKTLATAKNDTQFAEFCLNESILLKQQIEQNGWDGEWYRRAYFDDGTPLGSKSSQECQIDSISQSWAILSGAGESAHCRSALEAVDQRLVKREAGLIQLLDPPFDKSDTNPGYIKGYVPGVRENGGQYTHAAIWTAMAFAKSGDSKRTWELVKMINPINHALSAQAVSVYKVEPFVMAADIYAVSPHIGRGGWTWYTGSAGWMYRLIIESLLGIIIEADQMRFEPCVPLEWKNFKVNYRYQETTYQITMVKSGYDQPMQITLDGVSLKDYFVALVDDKVKHTVVVIFS